MGTSPKMTAVLVRSQKDFTDEHRKLYEDAIKDVSTMEMYSDILDADTSWELIGLIQEYLWIHKIGEHLHVMALCVNGVILYIDIHGEHATLFPEQEFEEFKWILPHQLYKIFEEMTEPYMTTPMNFMEDTRQDLA